MKYLQVTFLQPNISYTGSVEPENLRARFRTPVEVGWQWMAKLDHDFIGRKALEKEMSNPQKTIVSLIWNPEDILDVQASLYGSRWSILVAFRACVEDIRTMLPQGMARLLVYPVVRYIVPIIIK